jgi:4-diphosphocytidyl-2-C-methyl-D-erythritol kinase
MRNYTLLARAKINLYLEILGDRPDGYHELVMIMQSINLADKIELHPNGLQEFRIFCTDPQVPCDTTNLAYRAALLMQTKYPQAWENYGGVDITIQKRIPVAAGLAGGSANGAAVLVGLDLIWKLGLTQPEIETLAALLGSDVPFCVGGGTAIATGRGEKLAPIPDLEDLWVVLGKYNRLSVSTPWAYTSYRQKFADGYIKDFQKLQYHGARIHSSSLVQAIAHKDSQKIGQYLHNDLEKIVLPEYTLVAQLKETMAEAGGLGTMMSGSGPTVFTLCASETEAQAILEKTRQTLTDSDLRLWIAPLSSQGITIVTEGK